jgi:hypothetical protein
MSTGPKGFSMRRKKKNTLSIADMFWSFVEDNPKLAAKLAFELGSLAGTAVKNTAGTKKYLKKQAKNVPQAISDVVPLSLSSALKFLPAPKLQPRKRPQTKRASRKTNHATQ